MKINEDARNFWCFIATLAAIVALSKVGGTGADLAIMTGLVGVLGMLARPGRAEKQPNVGPNENVNVNPLATEPTP